MAQISIIIPAYNESAVIAQALAPFAGSKPTDGIEVIVIAYNCSDDTASVARQSCLSATVLETTTPGKPNAIGMGQEIAKGRALVFLDGDLVVPVSGIRALCDPILTAKSQASCGRMKVNLDGASYWVR